MSNLLIGVTGGIAAYKIPELVRLFIKGGYDVKTVLTKNAGLFVTKETLEMLTGNKVYTDNFSQEDIVNAEHIELAKWADVILIAPATFNTIGKIISGIADNLLTSIIAAADRKKIIFSPSMNVNMWNNPIFQENLKKLADYGFTLIEPGNGYLACGDTGRGRLPEIETIFAIVKRHIDKDDAYMGKRYIVTAGGTEEAIDPVRVITNRSSGKMGTEIAKQLYFKGADVVLVKGRTSLEIPPYLYTIEVHDTKSMLNSLKENISENTTLIMAAAISDFIVENQGNRKFHKDELNVLKLKENIDVTKTIREMFDIPIIGFALENGMNIEKAKEKLKKKRLNAIILNDISAIGNNNSSIRLIREDGYISGIISGSKEEIAVRIVEELKNI
ncbi:MAG TPA: bifunctional phosphopantothenoylcysteine decarboxylase/phosphopantothenate--cysteine ligase CoaBC [Bacteroidetes bacterium]|nr:bifunctional phosphopantothenoylcysteine decarboxylase/phosphopantothenate--cysteine ligase CoaBC [Bacteroidota bacterium]